MRGRGHREIGCIGRAGLGSALLRYARATDGGGVAMGGTRAGTIAGTIIGMSIGMSLRTSPCTAAGMPASIATGGARRC